jgi:flagellar biosynthesis GTPase FlhF
MATESDVRQSAHGVRTYRGRTLEEILPQVREELGPDAIILREREGLVGGVGGFFAQRFIEVEARRGDGQSIDIYDEDDLDEAPGLDDGPAEPGQSLLLSGASPEDEHPLEDEQIDISARRQVPGQEPAERSEPRPFVPPEVQRERIIPRESEPEEAQPTRRFETDIFLERLRAASQILPDDDELTYPGATVTPSATPEPVPAADSDIDEDLEAEIKPPSRQRRSPQERKPRGPQPRRPRPAPRTKAGPKAAEPALPTPAPDSPDSPDSTDAWAAAMAALVAEAEPEPSAPPPAASRPAPQQPAPQQPAPRQPAPRQPTAPQTASGYDALRRRPPALRVGLPTGPQAAPGGAPSSSTPPPQPSAPIPASMPIAPLEMQGRRDGAIRGAISRLLGGRFGASTLPKPSPPRPIDTAAAAEITRELSARGASQAWIAQLISSAAAHGGPLTDGLLAAAEAEIARRIVPAPALPVTGAAVAFIGAGGTGKTRCTAALASAYSRASTLGVTVIAIDNPSGGRELKRLLSGDGVPVLSLSGERAQRAVDAAREGGFVIVDTPATTPTDPVAIEALRANLAPLSLDAIFVTLPATLGSQAARRALASFGRLDPSAVAITHADETDQLAVVVEIAITHRIPLVYFHSGTDHQSALSAVEASALAQQLLATT